MPQTSFVGSFQFSNDPLWKSAWNERIKPHIDTYPTTKKELVQKILTDDTFTLYDNYFSIQTFDEYRNCEIVDIPQVYEPKAFAYAFAKGSPFLPIFNHYLSFLQESGTINKIIQRYLNDEVQQVYWFPFSGEPFEAFFCFGSCCRNHSARI